MRMEYIKSESMFRECQKTYNYTLDDFMKEYRVSERTAETLLKGVNCITISQSLYTRLPGVKRKKFYNRVEVFESLVNDGTIVFNVKFLSKIFIGTKQKNKETSSEHIPPSYVIRHRDIFMDIARLAKSAEEVVRKDAHKRTINRYYSKIEGIEVVAGKQSRRIYPLAKQSKHYQSVFEMMHISPRLIESVRKNKLKVKQISPQFMDEMREGKR